MSTVAVLNIRPATVADAGLILHFIRELAIYEKAEHSVQTDEIGIAESLFGADATACALICEANGEAIGYAVYFYNYSTWLGRKGIYLEDLYVSQEKRGAGAGKALLKYIARQADGRISSFIKCDGGTFRRDGVRLEGSEVISEPGEVAAGCVHYFVDIDNKLSVSLDYKRAFLKDWKRMEEAVRDVIARTRSK